MNYQKIYEFDLANGPGVRVSLFVSGCTIHCPGCFNKQAWDFKSGKPFTKQTFKALKKILKDERYQGFSILGGEPLDQDQKGLKILIKLCKIANKHNKSVWLWTGYDNSHDFNKTQIKLLKQCDIVVTGPYVESSRSFDTPFRGSSNQKLIQINKKN